MIQKNTITWNSKYENDGILFFTQRIIEMLDYETIDIFRAPLLNTTRLIQEYLRISEGAVKQFHLNEVLDELKVSLGNDVVLQYQLGEDRIAQIIRMLNSSDDEKTVIQYLNRSIVPHYLNWCIGYIKYIVPQNKPKKKMESAIRCYLPELFRYGYNREDIFYTYREAFLNATNPTEMFGTLLDTFNGHSHDYSVYLSLNKELAEFRDVFSKKLLCSLDDDGYFKRLNTWDGYFVIKMPQIKAMGMTAAVEKALERINTFLHFYRFFGNYSNKLVQSSALVISEYGTERIIYAHKDKYNSIEYKNHPQTGHLSTFIISRLVETSRHSISELKKALNLHNTAISNNGLENGFLNLWSILEITCVTDPDSSKIAPIISKLVPILKLNYLTSYFEHLCSNLKNVTDEDIWAKLLDSISEGTSDVEKIAYLTLCPKYTEKLDSYTDHFSSYPVLRTRLLNIHDDFFNKRREMFNHIERYAQRVSWHLYRMYRARNAITHNGKQPSDLKDLGEHLHAYVDCLVEEILIKMCTGSLDRISSVFIDSMLYLNCIEKYLKSDDPFDEEGIALIFSAQVFCWCNNKTITSKAISSTQKSE